MSAAVTLECDLIRDTISLNDVVGLKEGDVIPIEMLEEHAIKVNGVPMFKTQVGQANGNLALKVLELIKRPDISPISPLNNFTDDSEESADE